MNDLKIMDYINALTDIQREAVNWDEGPLILLAGPGSGKTRVLTYRIARLLQMSSEKNYRILGLTFTNKAADEMRTRIQSLIPGMEKRLFLGTFHSFCVEVLRNHGSYIDVNPNFTIYSNQNDLEEILLEIKKDLENQGLFEPIGTTNLIPIIQYLQRNLVMPNESIELISDNNLRKAISLIYNEFFNRLKMLNALDFDSLILLTYMLFSKFPFIAKHYRTVYPYICVDEFQDTNLAQYQLIRSLTKDKNRNIFIVADDDQIIYQWNGASYKRLGEFEKDYSADIIQLPDNFRCPPKVVELANNLIKHNVSHSKTKKDIRAMKNVNNNENVINLKTFDNFDDEINWIAEDINKVKRDDGDSTVAVIARTNKLLAASYSQLKSKNIPCAMAKRKNEFENPLLSWLHNILRLANKRNDKNYLTKVISTLNLFVECEINQDKIIALSESNDGDYLKGFYNSLIDNEINEKLLSSLLIYLVEGKDFMLFVNTVLKWFDEEVCPSIYNTSQEGILEDGEYLNYKEERQVWEYLLQKIRSMFDSNTLMLSTFLQELDLISKDREPDSSIVQCITIHSSKGKEFDHVYMIGMVESELPSFQSIKKGDKSLEMEEERRNCFVAITRTVKKLTLTYSSKYFGWSKLPSRFLYEMGMVIPKNE